MKKKLLRESKTALSANGLSSVKELDVLQETDDLNENSVLLDLNDSQSDEQQALQRRLCCIFDEVLVVDNVLAARKVVHLLTHEHRHRVHACDTEVPLLLQK